MHEPCRSGSARAKVLTDETTVHLAEADQSGQCAAEAGELHGWRSDQILGENQATRWHAELR